MRNRRHSLWRRISVTRVLVVLVLTLTVLYTASQPIKSAPEGKPKATPIAFASGKKEIVVKGTLSKKQTHVTYALRATAGQRLKIALSDLQKDGLVSTYSIAFPSGKVFGLKGYDPFPGKLTETGTYHITVSVNLMASNADTGSFRLTLTRPQS